MKDLAVLDIGSNSVRLMLQKDGKQRVVKETTRLGQGADNRLLQKEPLLRTFVALGKFKQMALDEGITEIYAFATSAVRDALNRDELINPVREHLGIAIDVLPGEVEAELAYLGAAKGQRAMVIDIGGGSTELVAGDKQVIDCVSLRVGAVRLKDEFPEDREGAKKHVLSMLSEQKARFANFSSVPLFGIGGTITTLAAMEKRIEKYSDDLVEGVELKHCAMKSWADRLWALPPERREFVGLGKKRRDIIAHGAEVLCCAMEALGRESVVVSGGDNLNGYLKWRGVR